MIEWLPAILSSIKDASVASILREKISLLEIERQRAISDRDSAALNLAKANAKIEGLEADNADLQLQLDQAKQEIAELKVAQEKKRYQDRPQEEHDILVLLSHGSSKTCQQIAAHFCISVDKALLFLRSLEKAGLVDCATR